jgi:hypothetical protein
VTAQRQKLAWRHACVTVSLTHAGLPFSCTYAKDEHGEVRDVRLRNHRGGSDADHLARDLGICASLCLQHNCSIETLRQAVNPRGLLAAALAAIEQEGAA